MFCVDKVEVCYTISTFRDFANLSDSAGNRALCIANTYFKKMKLKTINYSSFEQFVCETNAMGGSSIHYRMEWFNELKSLISMI